MTVKKLVLDKVHGDVLVEGVTFGYNPDKTILKDVSVFAHPGQKIALVGSTGAGKTTITNLITRFYNINKGKITIDGVDIKDISLECLRENHRDGFTRYTFVYRHNYGKYPLRQTFGYR